MANQPLQVIKAVSALPSPLAPNVFYLVRVGQGYDLYATDTTASNAYKINVSPNQLTDVIDIAQGGTGATDAAAARANLGVLSSNDVLDYILGYKDVSFDYIINKLFNNSEQGFAFDFNDLSTMYQDAAGTIPVTGVGQPVGKVLDKSGRGNHATQSTSAKRPILQQNTTTGAYYLLFDGVDDCLVTNTINFVNSNDFTLFFPHTKLLDSHEQCLFIIGSDNDRFYESGLAAWVGAADGKESYSSRHTLSGYNILLKTDNPLFNAPVDTVLTLKHDSTNKVHGFTLNRRFTKQINIGNSSPLNYQLCIGSKLNNDYPFNGNIYSVIGIARLATTTEITNTENAIAKNVGVTL